MVINRASAKSDTNFNPGKKRLTHNHVSPPLVVSTANAVNSPCLLPDKSRKIFQDKEKNGESSIQPFTGRESKLQKSGSFCQAPRVSVKPSELKRSTRVIN